MRGMIRSCLLVCALLLATSLVFAQGKKGKREITIEDDDATEAAEGPVTAGQMTEQAAQAKRLFDAERWSEAALMLKSVVDSETGDDEGIPVRDSQERHY